MKSKQKYENNQTNPVGALRILKDGTEWNRGHGWLHMKQLSSDLLRMIVDTKRDVAASTAVVCVRFDGATFLHSKNFYKTNLLKIVNHCLTGTVLYTLCSA